MTAQNYFSEYEPPYGSPIEEILAWHLHKHLRRGVKLKKQVEFITKHGLLRVDFALYDYDKERKIAVECDGRDFHDSLRDEIRDAILLGEGHVDTVYHFRGCDITYYPDDCVWLVSDLAPDLFSQRGHTHLGRLHRLHISEDYVWRRYWSESFSFNMAVESGSPKLFWAFRRSNYTRPDLNYHWKVLYAFAREHPGVSLEELFNIELQNIRTAGQKKKM